MHFAQLPYDVAPGGATEAVIHIPAVVVIVLLLPGDTPKEKEKEPVKEETQQN